MEQHRRPLWPRLTSTMLLLAIVLGCLLALVVVRNTLEAETAKPQPYWLGLCSVL